MQKLKKSLENNVLSTNLKNGSPFLSVETIPNDSSGNLFFAHLTKTLTTNSSRQLKFLLKLGLLKLKHPLVLKLFTNSNDLNEYYCKMEEKNYTSNFLATKSLNNVFKNDSYSVVKQVSSYHALLKLRNPLNPQTILLRIINLKRIFH